MTLEEAHAAHVRYYRIALLAARRALLAARADAAAEDRDAALAEAVRDELATLNRDAAALGTTLQTP